LDFLQCTYIITQITKVEPGLLSSACLLIDGRFRMCIMFSIFILFIYVYFCIEICSYPYIRFILTFHAYVYAENSRKLKPESKNNLFLRQRIFLMYILIRAKCISCFPFYLYCKKGLALFPSPAGMSLTKLSLAGNNLPISSPRKVWSKRIQDSCNFFYSVGKVDRGETLSPDNLCNSGSIDQ